MKKLKIASAIFFGLIYLFSLTSCIRENSDAVDQDRIFTVYKLFYNANEDKTYAQATFRFSNALGTKLELASPSTVRFNGNELTFQPLLAIYQKEYAGYLDSGTFEWEDTNGKLFTNSVHIIDIDYPEMLDSIDSANSYELVWQGTPLSQGEKVTVTINGNLEGDAKIFSTDDLNAKSIILEKDKLSTIGKGEITLWMDRDNNVGLAEQTSAGGIISGVYRPENAKPILK